MKSKLLTVNRPGCSIRCRLYEPETGTPERVIVYLHGFGGHKDNRAATRMAEHILSKRRESAAMLCFDLPCHGDDARRRLLLEDCDAYLAGVIAYVREQFPAARLQACATSFGGYLTLKYMAEHGSPFERVALRCPAVPMYDVMMGAIAEPEEREKLNRGKDALVGFDRKIRISPAFLDALRAADLRQWDFAPYRDEMLILHGTADEIVPFAAVEDFARHNGIAFFPVEGADHRFIDSAKMRQANDLMAEFLA